MGRLSVLIIAIISIIIAWTPNDTILNLVGNAWAGFGAAFGPLVLLSLLEGIKSYRSYFWYGSVVVIIWIVFVKPLGEYNDFFNLYEIIPGF